MPRSDSEPDITTGSSARSAGAIVAWIAALALAMGLLARYHGTAGDPGATPAAWPTTEPRLSPDGLEILLFVHPRCPCTISSIEAVATLLHLLESRGISCGVRVVIRTPSASSPPASDDAWRTSPTVDRLTRLGEHERQFDPGGVAAARWQAVTSGHVAIFASDGRRLLDGGLTPARSHAEDPAVLRAIADRLAAGRAVQSRPVFGCPIPDPARPATPQITPPTATDSPAPPVAAVPGPSHARSFVPVTVPGFAP